MIVILRLYANLLMKGLHPEKQPKLNQDNATSHLKRGKNNAPDSKSHFDRWDNKNFVYTF